MNLVKSKGRLRKLVALVAAGCMAFAAICCGRTLCLCSDDPDECGEPCHVCCEEAPDGLSASETCLHFSLDAMDFCSEETSVTTAGENVPSAAHGLAHIRKCRAIPMPRRPAMRSNAPPLKCSDTALFRTRRVLLQS